jgi:hypothetical protein
VGESRGGKAFVEGEEGCAIRTEVKVVTRGMEAERRARREVCRRCGRRVKLCCLLAIYTCVESERCRIYGVDACCAIFFW